MLLKDQPVFAQGEQSKIKGIMLLSLLPILMLSTRTDHFGSAVSLPDASLAVFFLSGFYLRRLRWGLGSFILLCVLAAGIDYWAITARGVSDYCVTAAYGLLLPTYFSVWWAGRWASSHTDDKFQVIIATVASLMVAFLISNGSFYLLSGHFTELSMTEYTSRVVQYLPRYLLTPLGYLAVAALFHFLMVRGGVDQVEQR